MCTTRHAPPIPLIQVLDLDSEGDRVVAVANGEVHVIDAETGTARPLYRPTTPGRVIGVAVGSSSAVLLTASGALSLWDLKSEEKIADIDRGLEGSFYALPSSAAISGDGTRIAATVPARVDIYDVGWAAIARRACDVIGSPLPIGASFEGLPAEAYASLCVDTADLAGSRRPPTP